MQKQSKNQVFKPKRKDNQLASIYSRCLLTKNIMIPITSIGKNIKQTIEDVISNTIEKKCIVEGYVKAQSTKIISYSSGILKRGINVSFEVVFECDICFPVEGMLISCKAININKAGIRAESSDETPSPITVFVARDHNFNDETFNNTKEGDIITVRIIGQRFELNDKTISIIGEIVKPKNYKENLDNSKKTKMKPKIIIE